MSSLYRLLCFHKPSLVQLQMDLIQKESHINRLKEQGCINWQYAQPLTLEGSHAPKNIGWVDYLDFQCVTKAKRYQATLPPPFPFTKNTMCFSALGEIHTIKKLSTTLLPPICIIRFAQKKPELSLSEFSDYWRLKHGLLATNSPFLAQYEQLHLSLSTPAPPLPWQGFTFSFFTKADHIKLHAQHPAGIAAAQDTANFLSSEPQPALVMTIQQHPSFNPFA